MSVLADPFRDGFVATPRDRNLDSTGSGMMIIADGDLAFTTLGGTKIGPFAVTAGQLIPFAVKQVNVGTTATVVVGMQ